MIDFDYAVDSVPSGEKRGKCPVCRKERLLHYYFIRAVGLGGISGRVYECTTCATRLTDTGVVGRILATLLLLSCLVGVAGLLSVCAGVLPEIFRNPSEVGVTLWAVMALLLGVILGAGRAVVKALRRIFQSRFVETKGTEYGI